MSATDTLASLYLDVICPRCGAGQGRPCRTTSGATTQTHAAGRNPIDYAFGEGYEFGRKDADEIAARHEGRR